MQCRATVASTTQLLDTSYGSHQSATPTDLEVTVDNCILMTMKDTFQNLLYTVTGKQKESVIAYVTQFTSNTEMNQIHIIIKTITRIMNGVTFLITVFIPTIISAIFHNILHLK